MENIYLSKSEMEKYLSKSEILTILIILWILMYFIELKKSQTKHFV